MRFIYLHITILLFLGNTLLAQEFSFVEYKQIEKEINTVLTNFEKYSTFTNDGLNLNKKYIDEFSKLFDSANVKINSYIKTNDLTQNEFNLQGFINQIKTSYPSGLDIKLNWNITKLSAPVNPSADDKQYYTFLPVEITYIGLYNSTSLVNNTKNVFIEFKFHKEKNVISNFKISSILLTAPEYIFVKKPKKIEEEIITEEPVVEKEEQTTESKPTKAKQENKNISLIISGGPTFTKIYSSSVFNDDYWEAEQDMKFFVKSEVLIAMSNFLNVRFGVGYSQYSTQLFLKDYSNKDNYTNNVSTDIDNDTYYLLVNLSVEESQNLTFLDIPLGIRLYLNHESGLRFYIDLGLQGSLLLSSTFDAKGNSDHSGYYSQYSAILYDLETYNFTSSDFTYENETWELVSFNLSGSASVGIEVPIGNSINLNIGAYQNYGITNLGYDTPKYRDDYISISGRPGNLNTRGYGISAGFRFNF